MLFPTKKARLPPGFFIKSFIFKYVVCKPFAFKYGGMKGIGGLERIHVLQKGSVVGSLAQLVR